MWIPRVHYETLVENLTTMREKASQLEIRVATQANTLQWLTTFVNRLETEREILTRERLHVIFPRTEIAFDKAENIKGKPTVALDETPERQDETSVPIQQILGSSLEDVGDELAARLGLAHSPAGELVYK